MSEPWRKTAIFSTESIFVWFKPLMIKLAIYLQKFDRTGSWGSYQRIIRICLILITHSCCFGNGIQVQGMLTQELSCFEWGQVALDNFESDCNENWHGEIQKELNVLQNICNVVNDTKPESHLSDSLDLALTPLAIVVASGSCCASWNRSGNCSNSNLKK